MQMMHTANLFLGGDVIPTLPTVGPKRPSRTLERRTVVEMADVIDWVYLGAHIHKQSGVRMWCIFMSRTVTEKKMSM
jgi:hypothetical protein